MQLLYVAARSAIAPVCLLLDLALPFFFPFHYVLGRYGLRPGGIPSSSSAEHLSSSSASSQREGENNDK